MDDRSFDALVRSLATGASRRKVLKGLLGLGGAAMAAGAMTDADAARRPSSMPTPTPRTCPGVQVPCGTGCCCPSGSDKCGPDCCPTGVAQCCDNACCYGTCYGEELCCPSSREFCAVTGECCPEGWTCCSDYGCISPEQCCFSADCPADYCKSSVCTADHVCSELVFDCNVGGAGECCAAGEVCLSDGTCCSPVCDGVPCGGSDGCGGTCGCPAGYGCGDDGVCHVCTVCEPVAEACPGEDACYTFCTPDGVICLSGFPVGRCGSQADCSGGAYCMETCVGLRCLPPCGPSAGRFAATESEGIDVIAG